MAKLPDETREQIVADINAGKSCRSIAQERGVAHSTVSNIAKAHGLTFARTAQTAAGTAAAKFDAKAARQAAVQRFYEDEARWAARCNEPYEFYMSTGDGVRRIVSELPPAKELKDFQSARHSAMSIAMKMELHDAADQDEIGKTMVNDLYRALRLAWEQQETEIADLVDAGGGL